MKTTEKSSPKKKKVAEEDAAKHLERQLREGIHDGKYVPGQRLVEIDLITEFGASQRQVRSALQRLEVEGLVTIEKNRGAAVRKLTPQDVSCIFDVLDSLTSLAIRRATESAKEPKIKSILQQNLNEAKAFAKAAANERRVIKYSEENIRFWDSIASVVHNPFLWETRSRLQSLIFCYPTQTMTLNSDPYKWIAYHEEILVAILDQNLSEALRLMAASSAEIRIAYDL